MFKTEVDPRNDATVTVDGVTYAVSIEVDEAPSGATQPTVHAVKVAGHWHHWETFAPDFLRRLEQALRAELAADAMASMEPAA